MMSFGLFQLVVRGGHYQYSLSLSSFLLLLFIPLSRTLGPTVSVPIGGAAAEAAGDAAGIVVLQGAYEGAHESKHSRGRVGTSLVSASVFGVCAAHVAFKSSHSVARSMKALSFVPSLLRSRAYMSISSLLAFEKGYLRSFVNVEELVG